MNSKAHHAHGGACDGAARYRRTWRWRATSMTPAGPFRPVKNNVTGELDSPLNPNSVYRNIVQKYGLEKGARYQTRSYQT
jgi:hypothetical protein